MGWVLCRPHCTSLCSSDSRKCCLYLLHTSSLTPFKFVQLFYIYRCSSRAIFVQLLLILQHYGQRSHQWPLFHRCAFLKKSSSAVPHTLNHSASLDKSSFTWRGQALPVLDSKKWSVSVSYVHHIYSALPIWLMRWNIYLRSRLGSFLYCCAVRLQNGFVVI